MVVDFQEPGRASAGLLEALLEASDGASSGGAIFAWVNASGAIALLDDVVFVRFLAAGDFDLVVGVDSITDEAALNTLQARVDRHDRLTARAFVHQAAGLFHPKLAWFCHPGGKLRLVVGSGNLTMGGLKNNWEAFVVADLQGDDAAAALDRLNGWLDAERKKLRPLDDPDARARAAANTGRETDLRRLGAAPPAPPTPPGATYEVLVAELPKGDRWKQANFNRFNYEDFFGARIGSQVRVALYHVDDAGNFGDVEVRPSVEVRSQNYRFELEAASGLAYPTQDVGRPIAVFVRVAASTFVYRLVMPGDASYAALLTFVESRAPTNLSPARMRRIRTTVAELRSAWPASPLWSASLEDL